MSAYSQIHKAEYKTKSGHVVMVVEYVETQQINGVAEIIERLSQNEEKLKVYRPMPPENILTI